MPYMIPVKRDNHGSKKIFLWPILISIIGHVALITVSSMVDLRDNVKADELFTVQLTEPAPVAEPQKDQKKEQEKKPREVREGEACSRGRTPKKP